jgi:hypothetical protein
MRKLLFLLASTLPLSATTLYYTAAGGQGLSLPFGISSTPNSTTASNANSITSGSSSSTYSSSANLTTGTIRIKSSGSFDSSFSGDANVLGSSFASLADTFTLGSTSGAGGLQLGLQLRLSGAWTTSSNVLNFSTLALYILEDGSFDTPNATDPVNVIYNSFYGLGPNALQDSIYPLYNGYLGQFPSTVTIALPTIGTLPSRFQVLLVSQIVLLNGNFANSSWNADLGSTIEATFLAPEGVSLTSSGGIPTGSEVPEPSTLLLCGAALSITALRRRKSN